MASNDYQPVLLVEKRTALPYLGWLLKPQPRKDNAVSMDEIIIGPPVEMEQKIPISENV